MIGEIAVIFIILITIALVYLKSSAVKAFMLLINTFIAATIAFSYYETLGRLIIGYDFMPKWVFGGVLLVIFGLVSAILNVIGEKLITTEIYFGEMPDKVAKCIIAIFPGLSIAGVILTAMAMLPFGAKLPYERYSATPLSAEPQKKLILNADGFITNMVSLFSRGSMSGTKSMAVFHPRLLDEIYLNRIAIEKDNLSYTKSSIAVDFAISPPAPLISAKDKQPLSRDSQTKPVIINTRLDGSMYTISQIRLICKKTDTIGDFKGSGQVFWPTGYITQGNIIQLQNLSDNGQKTQADFVFYIPVETSPVLLEYKLNGIAEVGRVKTPESPAQEPNSVK